jgi:hypothetical protein
MRTLPGRRRRCGERRQERQKRIGLRQVDPSARLFLDAAPPIESGKSETAQLGVSERVEQSQETPLAP